MEVCRRPWTLASPRTRLTADTAISVDPNGDPVGSILEAAHLGGLKTGIVVTSRMTHATPAVYSAHVLDRDSENEIATHQIGYKHPFGKFIDILIGGGRQHYLPSSEGGEREDGVNLIQWAKKHGYTYASDRSEVEESLDKEGRLPLPFLGLLADNHVSYEIDRDPEETPSLHEVTKLSLETLAAATRDEDKGFFLMVEASRIDHAAHNNDAGSHLHDTLMYNEVIAYLKEWVSAHPDTQLLSAADHECGGLTLIDDYDPTVLARVQASGEILGQAFEAYDGDDRAAFLTSQLPDYGFQKGDYTDDDVAHWLDVYDSDGYSVMASAITRAQGALAGINWSSTGHSALDVQLHGYAADPADLAYLKTKLGTQNNNIVLPQYVAEVLGVSLDDATDALRKNGSDWVERRHLLDKIKRDNSDAKHHRHHS